MRILLTLIFILTLNNVKSQSVFSSPNFSQDSISQVTSTNNILKQKWFLSTNRSINTGISFFKSGHATFVSMPMTLQLNRRLNENLYAFVNVGVTPAYINFSPTYNNGFGKSFQPNSFNPNSLHLNPSASFGLMYVNDAKTFSVSGSFTAEQNNYPMVPFYNGYQNHFPASRN